MIAAGQLDKRVTIQSRASVQDSQGGETVTWSDLVTVWAQIEPLGGRELLNAQQIAVEVDIRVRIRYLAAVTAAHRLKYGSRIFEIVNVQDTQERHEELVLLCSEAP